MGSHFAQKIQSTITRRRKRHPGEIIEGKFHLNQCGRSGGTGKEIMWDIREDNQTVTLVEPNIIGSKKHPARAGFDIVDLDEAVCMGSECVRFWKYTYRRVVDRHKDIAV
jgi:hypothetical protein